jgi:hypothetical protein
MFMGGLYAGGNIKLASASHTHKTGSSSSDNAELAASRSSTHGAHVALSSNGTADTTDFNSTASSATAAAATAAAAAAAAAAAPGQAAMKPILGSLLAFCDAQREAKFQLFYAQQRSYFDRIGLYACLLQLLPGRQPLMC